MRSRYSIYKGRPKEQKAKYNEWYQIMMHFMLIFHPNMGIKMSFKIGMF